MRKAILELAYTSGIAGQLAFMVLQVVIAGLLALGGAINPWSASVAWWPWTATLTSLVCLVMLSGLLRREGGQLRDLYRLDRRYIGIGILTVVGGCFGDDLVPHFHCPG